MSKTLEFIDRERAEDALVVHIISNFADVGDVSTLSNPDTVDHIRHHVQSEKVARGEVPRDLSPQERREIAAFGRAE